jgi:hypothetical protein
MKAKILREENLPAESLPSLRKLMKSPQNYHAAALLYANACIDVGAFKEAQTVLMDLKDHKESQPKALYLLSLVGKLVEDAKFEDKLKQLLSRPDLVPQDKVDVFYAYSKYCDDTGRYGEAIEYAMAAKNMEKKHFDLSKYQSFVDAHIAAIDTDMFDKLYHENKSTTQFCFVVGMPRSGTTLAEQTIVKLDGAVSLGEQQYFRSVANQLGMNADFQGYLARLKSQTTSELFKIRENYESICRKAGDGNLYIDKMPHNYEVLPLIRLCFPDAKFVWCQRNPIDTCLSIFLHRFSDMHAYSATLKSLGAYYKEYERLMLHYQTIPALHAFGLEYERLVSDGGELRQALLDWLKPGAIYDENKTSTVRTFSRWQVRQPIYQSSVERWRRYESHIADLLTALHWPRDKS